jgi:hypothetical protein
MGFWVFALRQAYMPQSSARGDDARGSALVVLAILGTASVGTSAIAPFIDLALPAIAAGAAILACAGLLALRLVPSEPIGFTPLSRRCHCLLRSRAAGVGSRTPAPRPSATARKMMMMRRLLPYAPIGALMLASAQPTVAQNAPAGASEDFEAALSRTQVRPVPASPPATGSRLGRAGGSGYVVAAPGTLPAHWHGVRTIDGQAWRQAESEARDGLLDPWAFLQKFYGTLPVPTGFQPVRCTNRIGEFVFSSGLSISAEYDTRLAEDASGKSKMVGMFAWFEKTAKTAMAKKMTEMEGFYQRQGYRRVGDGTRLGRVLYVPRDTVDESKATQYELNYGVNSTMKLLCKTFGASLSSGPYIRVRLRQPEFSKRPASRVY